jgi:hypothetical protein
VTVREVKKQALHALSFLVTLAVVVGVLKFMNWAPGALEPGLMSRYQSINDVETTLGIRKIYVPAYFPESIGWPPAVILAQSNPYPAVVMEFARTSDGETMLVIAQTASRSFNPEVAIRFHTISETVPLELRGRRAQLDAGLCEDRTACSRLEWDEGDVHLMLTMKAPSVELIRIAESMLH